MNEADSHLYDVLRDKFGINIHQAAHYFIPDTMTRQMTVPVCGIRKIGLVWDFDKLNYVLFWTLRNVLNMRLGRLVGWNSNKYFGTHGCITFYFKKK